MAHHCFSMTFSDFMAGLDKTNAVNLEIFAMRIIFTYSYGWNQSTNIQYVKNLSL